MLPQNAASGRSGNQYQGFVAGPSQNGTDGLSFNLDPFTAKQMAALQATSLAKAANRSAPGGTSASYFGGMSNQPNLSRSDLPSPHDIIPPLSNYQAMNNPVPQPNSLQPRKRQFLNGLSNLMNARGTPLPPAFTGIPAPAFDISTSPWKLLEISPAEPGIIYLAGKEVDIYKLWAVVVQLGGGQKVTQQNQWGSLLPHFGLPEHSPTPLPNGQQAVAHFLSQLYMHLISPFEEVYRRNMQAHQQRALAARAQATMQQPDVPNIQGRPGMSQSSFSAQGGQLPGPPSNMNAMLSMDSTHSMDSGSVVPPQPHSAPQLPPHSMNAGQDIRSSVGPLPPTDSQPMSNNSFPLPSQAMDGLPDVDADVEGRKRKMREFEELEAKRVRPKIEPDTPAAAGSIPPIAMNGTLRSTPIRQPSRRKIEYVPFAREVESAGGRDLTAIQNEWTRMSHRPYRPIDDWGTVDVDALTLSLRSRIATELSYALTTFTLLTLMRGSTKDAGFPIAQCPDLLEEVLDLIEDVAFDGVEDTDQIDDISSSRVVTHKELVNVILTDEHQLFSNLVPKPGVKTSSLGPAQRPGDTILVVMNIIRNLSIIPENHDHLAKHDRLLSIIFRLCSLAPTKPGFPPTPLSPVLSLSDVVSTRKDVVLLLFNIAGNVALSSGRASNLLNARRAFEVLAAYFIDPSDSVPPYTYMTEIGLASHLQPPKPPSLVDTALEVFARLTHPDNNREALSKAVPIEWMWQTVEALVHRLPVSDIDYQAVMRETWIAYLERVILSLYSMTFVAPPQLKKRIKHNRSLGFTKILLRLTKKFIAYGPQERMYLLDHVRRAIEALKLVDDEEDLFDMGQTTAPSLTFGMGYGEHGENRAEKGMGLLSGYQEDITWGLMVQREVDSVMFSELASLVRVE